jgi:hypothetical protein
MCNCKKTEIHKDKHLEDLTIPELISLVGRAQNMISYKRRQNWNQDVSSHTTEISWGSKGRV